MNVIIATTELINVYLDELVAYLPGETVIFEFAPKKIIYDRSYKIFSFVYNGGYDQVIKLRKAKAQLDAILKNDECPEFLFNHPFDLLCNYAAKCEKGRFNIIPDGMLNFVEPLPANKISRKVLLNRQIKSFLAMTFFRLPKKNILGEGDLKYHRIFSFAEQGLYVPSGASVSIIRLNRNVSRDGLAVFLGQYTSQPQRPKYEHFVLEVLKKEKKVFDKVYYRPHPSESISENFKRRLDGLGIFLDRSSKVAEFNDNGYSVFIGIFSSPLIHMKLLSSSYKCISYPKDFWGKGDRVVREITEKMKFFGCEIKDL